MRIKNTFVAGRQILDAVMVANEVVDDMVGKKKVDIVCKINMEKAYDHVCRDFVIYMLKRLGFGEKWRKWIITCISTSFTVLANGGPSSFFRASRDLRQRDPLSPLLFLTVMEAFSRLMDRIGKLNLVRGIMVGMENSMVKVSHLFFADDTLIFCEPDLSSMLHLRCILLSFQLVSGLRINMKKTEMIRSCDRRDELGLAEVLGCKVNSLPIKYLELPLGTKYKDAST